MNSLPEVEVSSEEDYIDLSLTSHLTGDKLLLELKTFPTNYGQAGKPITQFIDSVIADLSKLRARASDKVLAPVHLPWPTELTSRP